MHRVPCCLTIRFQLYKSILLSYMYLENIWSYTYNIKIIIEISCSIMCIHMILKKCHILFFSFRYRENMSFLDYNRICFWYQIELVPCNKSGKEYAEDEVFVEDTSELVGKELYFKLKLENAMGLPSRFTVSFRIARSYIYSWVKKWVMFLISRHSEHIKCYDFKKIKKVLTFSTFLIFDRHA